jgi:hypothetical protein
MLFQSKNRLFDYINNILHNNSFYINILIIYYNYILYI